MVQQLTHCKAAGRDKKRFAPRFAARVDRICTPEVGSSRNIREGPASTLQAMERRRFWPPEMPLMKVVPTVVSAAVTKPRSCSTLSTRAALSSRLRETLHGVWPHACLSWGTRVDTESTRFLVCPEHSAVCRAPGHKPSAEETPESGSVLQRLSHCECACDMILLWHIRNRSV
jgi:hypothetical protein